MSAVKGRVRALFLAADRRRQGNATLGGMPTRCDEAATAGRASPGTGAARRSLWFCCTRHGTGRAPATSARLAHLEFSTRSSGVKGLANPPHGGNGMFIRAGFHRPVPAASAAWATAPASERYLCRLVRRSVEPAASLIKDLTVGTGGGGRCRSKTHVRARAPTWPRRPAWCPSFASSSMYVHHGSRRMNAYLRPYCRQLSDPSQPTCPLCGAPGRHLGRVLADSAGLSSLCIKDMAKVTVRPVAPPDRGHHNVRSPSSPLAHRRRPGSLCTHVLLWLGPGHPAPRTCPCAAAGSGLALPVIMVEAHGPGHIACLIPMCVKVHRAPAAAWPLMWVREHWFLCAMSNIRDHGTANTLYVMQRGQAGRAGDHYPLGWFGDIFTATDCGCPAAPAPGNAFIRDLSRLSRCSFSRAR